MVELMASLVVVGHVQASGKVEEAGQNVFGHGERVAVSTRGAHHDVATPQVAA